MVCLLQADTAATPVQLDLEIMQSAAAELIMDEVNTGHSCAETSCQVAILIPLAL